MEITKRLADYIANTKYESLPPEVVRSTKRHILDILGVMLPSSTLEKGCIALEEIAREGGGKTESTLIGFGGKVPCWMAAFVNGSLCHTLDYDDTIDEFPNHPSAHTFPAALAVAEKIGNVSGKEFITAIALSLDLNVRLAASPKGSLLEDYPWFAISVFGLFAATAAASKLLLLTDEEIVNAFGIAIDRVSGITESVMSPGSEIRAIGNGFANREGVFAALMAKKGIIAYRDPIEILYRIFYKNNYNSSMLSTKLGTEFWGLKVGLKAWPCCRVTHTYVRAALDIAIENDVDPDKIEEVLLTVGRFGRDVLFSPLEAQRRPELSINAKMSLPFVMGVVFAKRRVAINDFFPENLRDSKVLGVANKVKYRFDPKLSDGAIGAGVVQVSMQGGESFLKREDIPYGHPKNPMSDEELVAKFNNCARYAKKALSEEEVTKLVEYILNLEKVKNMTEITKAFV